MDNLFFQDNSQIYNINLSKEAYKKMLCYCNKAHPYETGGILIGNYSQSQTIANILQITPPPKNSKHAKCNFYRGSGGLKKLLDTVWNQGLYYLGEWHYHPNASSLPSGIDNNQMIKLSRDQKLNCPEPILIIIGGYKDNWNINARLYVNSQEIIMNPKSYKMILLIGAFSKISTQRSIGNVPQHKFSSKSCVLWALGT